MSVIFIYFIPNFFFVSGVICFDLLVISFD